MQTAYWYSQKLTEAVAEDGDKQTCTNINNTWKNCTNSTRLKTYKYFNFECDVDILQVWCDNWDRSLSKYTTSL